MNIDYKAAYQRQKQARVQAEQLLEDRSRELYDSNQTLIKAFDELKEQKLQMLHQEKLASIGQLSAGVAHEINNPAGYVKSNLNSLARYLDTLYQYIATLEQQADNNEIQVIRKKFDISYIQDDLKELVDDSLEGMERVASIVKSLKDFARPDTEDATPYSINSCIQNTLKLVNNEVKYRADVKTDFGELPLIHGQPGNMSQVFLNLIVNAAQAMNNKGEIKISTKADKNNIFVIISDNGCGIPEQIQNKIFDPFFTTKKVGDGTGLGLSIVHSIIQKQGGSIRLQSSQNQGCEFEIILPIAQTDTA